MSLSELSPIINKKENKRQLIIFIRILILVFRLKSELKRICKMKKKNISRSVDKCVKMCIKNKNFNVKIERQKTDGEVKRFHRFIIRLESGGINEICFPLNSSIRLIKTRFHEIIVS